MDETLNTIINGDCIAGMNALPAGSVDLAFADPPFNIGYEYDVYQDRQQAEDYLAWSREWIAAVYRVLKPDGTFWLAIGDEYAAELKIASQQVGFHSRSWVIWYYTFGVNCTAKFSRSHAHLFYFTKHREKFTFRRDDPANRIPSARQLVYNDKRANPRGRLPDDTWIIRPGDCVGELMADNGTWSPAEIPPPADPEHTFVLRPQDIAQRFSAEEDTWYFPRVAGTFKERQGFHGCQMPEQLLGRIIRYCSEEGEVVLDPFSGSATTLAVAKKLGRRYVGFELSAEYVKHGLDRLDSIRVGDRLDGSEEPTASAPPSGTRKPRRQSTAQKRLFGEEENTTQDRFDEAQLQLTLHGVVEAFRLTHDGYTADRVVCDPALSEPFAEACGRLGLVGDSRTWNTLLLDLRKAGEIEAVPASRSSTIEWEDCDRYLFASEIALQQMLSTDRAESLDEILCDPTLAAEFDGLAARLAPGFTPFEYRWAALKLRTHAQTARSRGAVLPPPKRMGRKIPLAEFTAVDVPDDSGVYLLSDESQNHFYVGEALQLSKRLAIQFDEERRQIWQQEISPSLTIQAYRTKIQPAEMLSWQSCLIRKYEPRMNFRELATV
jgi:DNA modification methylase